MSDRLMLISADNHWGPKLEVYRDLTQRRWHDRLADYIKEQNKMLRQRREAGEAAAARGELSDDPLKRESQWRRYGVYSEERVAFATANDATDRLRVLAGDGEVAEVVFPDGSCGNPVPFTIFGGVVDQYDLEIQDVFRCAYNRWLASVVDPERQAGLALLASYHDEALAIAEIYRAKEGGLRGLLFDVPNPMYTDVPPLDHPFYDGIWKACAEVGFPVHTHEGMGRGILPRGGFESTLPIERRAPRQFIGEIELHFSIHRPLWWFIAAGVLARNPNLRLVLSEQGSRWAIRVIQAMDHIWSENRGGQQAYLAERPSFYWERQCWIGASFMTREEIAARHEVGVKKLMYGSDHPHDLSTYGETVEFLHHCFGAAKVTEEEARLILGGTAAEVYGFDGRLLQELANVIGPEPEEILTPPEGAYRGCAEIDYVQAF